MPKIESSNFNSMMRNTAVDMEQDKQFLDDLNVVNKTKQKILCKSCLILLYTGVFSFLGFYIGYTYNICDNDNSS